MKKTALIPVTLSLLGALALGACSANPATGKQSFTGFMSPEEEIRVGVQEHPKVLEQFGGELDDPKLAAYVQDLGYRLAQTSEMPNLAWKFTIVNSPIINAFALPGGYIYVSRGLMGMASNEAELAGVLSHEIGHVTARHIAQRYSTAQAANIGVNIIGVIGQAAGLGRAGGDLASLGATFMLQSFSREQESESDMLGVRYMTNLGYDPQGMVTFFEKLRASDVIEAKKAGKDEKSVDAVNLLSTHPRTKDRIEQSIDLAHKNGGATHMLNVDRYLLHIDGLAWGDDESQGTVRGRVFTHAALGFRFEVPEGFKIENHPDIVFAKDEAGTVIKFAGAATREVKDAGSMERYLLYRWTQSGKLEGVEHITINGMQAVTGRTRMTSGFQTFEVRRIVIEMDKDNYWRFQFEVPSNQIDKMNEPLRRTTYSFRKPTSEEMKEARAFRVRVVEVGPGVTKQNLIDSMAIPEFKDEYFHAINGFAPDDAAQPGQKVKVIK